jgi:ABC-type uncharacterized transport system permease subunit
MVFAVTNCIYSTGINIMKKTFINILKVGPIKHWISSKQTWTHCFPVVTYYIVTYYLVSYLKFFNSDPDENVRSRNFFQKKID